ncbi:MAG: GDP-mannose 4,6-dehydratase [Candidatus Chisholmbacteria bacterium]|nr:GDP-mannose 4,6-dehydratase [Candidatus Chisholmbacteria bacterium]
MLQILAAYITEGNATFNKANGGYIVEIGQKDEQWLQETGNLIKKQFGYNFYISKGKKGKFTFFHLQVSNKKFFTYLIDSCGRYSHKKFFPSWIFDLPSEHREFFWQKLLEGDGTKDGRYTTTSYKLANQISLLLTLQGKKFTVFERNHPKYKTSFEFKTLSDGYHYGLSKKSKAEIDYDGWVYDVEIDKTHNFVCGIGNIVCHNTHVDRSILGPGVFIITNVVGTQVLLEAALEHQVQKFIHISTDEVFGDLPFDSKDKFNETSPYRPSSPYAASKAAADHLVRAYHRTYQLPAIITNCSNNYGPYQFPEKFIPLAITNIIEGKKAPLYGEGKNIRDWLYVGDHCRAIDLAIQKGKVGETYCIGGMTTDISNRQVLAKICQLMSVRFDDCVAQVTDRPGHDRKYAIDWSKIKSDLGWQPEHDFDTWLAQTIDWYKQNQSWWKPLKEESVGYFKDQYGE